MSDESSTPTHYDVPPEQRQRARRTGYIIAGLVFISITITFTSRFLGW